MNKLDRSNQKASESINDQVFMTSSNNELILFSDFSSWISKLLEDIEQAVSEILMEMYIIEPFDEGVDVARALARAAKRGVRTRLIYDSLGCMNVPGDFFAELADAGVMVREFNPIRLWYRMYAHAMPFHKRNHRKLVVIDSTIGHIGGMNISGRFRDWLDVTLRVKGKIAESLRASHQAVWERRHRKFIYPIWKRTWPDREIQVFDYFPSENFSPVKKYYMNAIHKASSRFVLAHAYFFPDKRLRHALRKAAKRGVAVEVIVPERSDIAAVDYASRHRFGKMLRDGIRIYQHHGPMLHIKAAISDDNLATIGSANLDPVSFFRCLEINVGIKHKPLVSRLSELIEEYKRASKEITFEEWVNRGWRSKLIDWFWYLIRKWFF